MITLDLPGIHEIEFNKNLVLLNDINLKKSYRCAKLSES